jgi:hypothetical protein
VFYAAEVAVPFAVPMQLHHTSCTNENTLARLLLYTTRTGRIIDCKNLSIKYNVGTTEKGQINGILLHNLYIM